MTRLNETPGSRRPAGAATILVVDDEPELVGAVRLRLRSAGYTVLSAGDGHSAVRMAARTQPDLIVLDIGLPGEDGHEIARRLRASARTRDIPLVFFTARENECDVDKAWDVGAVGYLTKAAGRGTIAGSEALLRAINDTLEVI